MEKEIVPQLFAGKTSAETIRVWSVGCATGEEAYSLAMLLDEFASGVTNAPKIQIFASDINERAIATGRNCFYEEPIIADVSPERLKRYFTPESGGWRVRQALRELIVFAPHNILHDPPYSRLDLIVCRNLLIYFNRETQARVFGIFNFALRGAGFLFLGSSESAENSAALFSVKNKKHQIYKARPVGHHQTLPALPAPAGWHIKPEPPIEVSEQPISYGELHYKLVEQFAPPSILVNEDYDVVHISEHADRYLRVTVGEPTHSLLKIVNPALKLDLQSALLEAKKAGFVGESRNVRFADEAAETFLNIIVRYIQATDSAGGFYLIVFDESKTGAATDGGNQMPTGIAGRNQIEAMVQQLEKELQLNRERLRATIEQNETSSEELKASNEELQAINEEQRSTAEELETSKEELQSLNEELTTLNAELKDKVDETLALNADLRNLIQSTDIGTLFLDSELRVKRYTPRIADFFNIIQSDIGRPFGHLTHKFDDNLLAEDAARVLQTLQVEEREVRSNEDGRIYLVRVVPYRTLENKIDGVVLSFQNITELKRAFDALYESENRFAAIFKQTTAGMSQTDLTGKFILVNERFCEITGYSRDELLMMRMHDLTSREDLPGCIELFDRGVPAIGEPLTTEKRYLRKDGSTVWANDNITVILGAEGQPRYTFIITLDVTEFKDAEEKVEKLNRRNRDILESISEAFFSIAKDWSFSYANEGTALLFDRSPESLLGRILWEEYPGMLGSDFEPAYRSAMDDRVESRITAFYPNHKRWYEINVFPATDGITVYFRNVTERKQAEEALQESEERFRAMFEQANIGIVQIDFGGRFLAVNPGFRKIVGYAEDELLHTLTVQDITHPDDYKLEEAENSRLAKGTIDGYSIEKRYVHENNSIVWGTMTTTVIRRQSGESMYLLAIVEDITSRKQAEEDLRTAKEELEIRVRERTNQLTTANQQLQAEILERKQAQEARVEILQLLVTAQEDERRRIARDLHDQLGQQLTALRLKIEIVKSLCENEELCEQIEETQSIARQIDADIDFLAWEMRPSALDDIGLVAALANFIGEWSRHFNISADFQAARFGQKRLTPEVETNLYRITQEALNNIFKHARATSVDISLERRDNFAILVIEDDGIGFEPETQVSGQKNAKRIGLTGMRERASLIGGSLEIESASGVGTTIFVRIPIQPLKTMEKGEKKDE